MRIYCIHDSDPELKRKGAFEVTSQQAKELNKQGYGVFWTPNDFNGARKAENLVKINYWLADIDDGSKEEQLERINNLPLKPSVIVETKKGYHCYWKAENSTIEFYRDIELGLIDRLKADKACKDVCRLLRMPNYYHQKDIHNPYLVKIFSKNDISYTESKMLFAYELPKPVYKKIEYKGDKQDFLDENNWEKIFRISSFMSDGRNNSLTRVCFWLRDEGFDRATIENTIYRINQKLTKPLDLWEVKSILRGKL